jgi:hypothetical protein
VPLEIFKYFGEYRYKQRIKRRVNKNMCMPRTKDFVKLRKSGNSLVITVPKDILSTLGWKAEDELFIEVKGETLVVKKA